ncbi:hypothetical protein V8F20_000398 [Naviculisporaceae sp. PSN 640]
MFAFLPKVNMAYLSLLLVGIAAMMVPMALFIEAILFIGTLEDQFVSVAATIVAYISSAVATASEAAIVEVGNVIARCVLLYEQHKLATKIVKRLLVVSPWLAQQVHEWVLVPLWYPIQDMLCHDKEMFKRLARRLLALKKELKTLLAKYDDMDSRNRANCEQCRKVHAELASVYPWLAASFTLPVWIPGTPIDTPKVPAGTRPTIFGTLFSRDRVDWRLQPLRELIIAYQECIANVKGRLCLAEYSERTSSGRLTAMRNCLSWQPEPIQETTFPVDKEMVELLAARRPRRAALTTTAPVPAPVPAQVPSPVPAPIPAPVPDATVQSTVTAPAVDAPTVAIDEVPVATEAVIANRPSPLPLPGETPAETGKRVRGEWKVLLRERHRAKGKTPAQERDSREEQKTETCVLQEEVEPQEEVRVPEPSTEPDSREEQMTETCVQQEEVEHQEAVRVPEETSPEPDVPCSQQGNVEDEVEVDEDLLRFCEEELLRQQQEEQAEAPSQVVEVLPAVLNEEEEGSRQIQSTQHHDAEEVSQPATYTYTYLAVSNSAEDQTSPTEADLVQAAPESTPMDLDESGPTTITEFASDGMQLDDITTSDRRRYAEEASQDAFDPELMDSDVHVDNQTDLDGAVPAADALEPMEVEEVDLAPTQGPGRESPVEMDVDAQNDLDEARPVMAASEPMDVDEKKPAPQFLPFVFNGGNLGSEEKPAAQLPFVFGGVAQLPNVMKPEPQLLPPFVFGSGQPAPQPAVTPAPQPAPQPAPEPTPMPTPTPAQQPQQPGPSVAAGPATAAALEDIQKVMGIFKEDLDAAEEERRREREAAERAAELRAVAAHQQRLAELAAAEEESRRRAAAEAQARAREEEAALARRAQAQTVGGVFQFQAGEGEALFDASYDDRYDENGELLEEAHRWMYRNRDPNAAVEFDTSYEQRFNEDGTPRQDAL